MGRPSPAGDKDRALARNRSGQAVSTLCVIYVRGECDAAAMRYVDYALDSRRDHLVSWLREQLATATTLHFRTGFITSTGIKAVIADLEALLEAGGQIRALIGGDPIQCDPLALRQLLRLVRIYPERLEAKIVVHPDFQNAKTYLVEHPGGRRCAWVGSANLTNGGLTENYEAAILLDSTDDASELFAKVIQGHEVIANMRSARFLTEHLIREIEGSRLAADFGMGNEHIEPPEELFDGLLPCMDTLDSVASGEPLAAGLPTGFRDLDACLCGLTPGSLNVIAARPGVGRTTMALQLLRAAALRSAVPAALFTFESTRQKVIERLIAAEARLNLSRMRSGLMTDDEWTRMATTMKKIAEAPLVISSTAAPDLDALQLTLTQTVREHQSQLVAIDPLNMIVARKFADNREREVAEIARRLKAIAMDLNVVIVSTTELSRAADMRADKRPVLSDLRDADAIAQVSDVALLLHRPDAYERDDPRAGEIDIIIAKNRNGPTCTITVGHQLHYGRFVDFAPLNELAGSGNDED